MNEHQALLEAKKILLTDGWAQFGGTMAVHDDGVSPTCINIAICRASQHEMGTLIKSIDIVSDVLGFHQDSVESIPEWNDAPERTLEEVIDVLDKAIAQTAPEPDVSFLEDIEATETQEVEYAEAV